MLDNLQQDIWALMVSRGVRAFAFSYLNVVFTIYLAQLATLQIQFIFRLNRTSG